jgi:WD40 repeat protein
VAVDSAAFSPDGQTVVTAHRDGKARFWSVGREWCWRAVDANHDSDITYASFLPAC